MPERKDVRVRQVQDMDVVAQTCTVGRGIIPPKDLDAIASPQRRITQQREEVTLRPVVLSKQLARTRGVEIPQRSEPQTIAAMVPVEYLLEHQLGRSEERRVGKEC